MSLSRPAALALTAAFILSTSAPPAHAQFWRREVQAETPIGAAVSAVNGDVKKQPKGSGDWRPAAAQEALDSGDRIRTGAGGSAVIAMADGSVIEIGANSRFLFEDHSAKKVKLNLSVGLIKAWIKKASRRYTVRTPTSVAAIRGTEFTTEVDSTGMTVWDLFSGSIDVTDNFGNSHALVPGYRIVAQKTTGLSEAKALPPAVKMAPKPQAALPPPGGPKPPPGKKDDKKDDGKGKKRPPPPPGDGQLLPFLPPPPPEGSINQNILLAPPPELSPSSP